MYTSPLVIGVDEATIVLKNGWSISATAENLAYVYSSVASRKAIGIKVNNLILKPTDIEFLYSPGSLKYKLHIDDNAPGGLEWI